MDPKANGSNTTEKVRILPSFFKGAKDLFGGDPDVIVAFGTAGIPSSVAFNGCVAVGTRVFVHDPFKDASPKDRVINRNDGNKDRMWTHPWMDKILTSALPGTFFRNIPDTVRYAAESRFIKPPIHRGKSSWFAGVLSKPDLMLKAILGKK